VNLEDLDVTVDGAQLLGKVHAALTCTTSGPATCPPRGRTPATSATSATPQVSDSPEVAGRLLEARPPTDDEPVTCTVAQVAEVADTPQRSDGDDAEALAVVLDTLGGEVISDDWPEGTIGADAYPPAA
jgi:hypothetical protein